MTLSRAPSPIPSASPPPPWSSHSSSGSSRRPPAAYALGGEARRGHLAPGMLGDVTILSGDVSSATADEIRAMEVIVTIVDGIVVPCSDTSVCAGG